MANSTDSFTSQERFESIKVGILSGAIAAVVALGFSLLEARLNGAIEVFTLNFAFPARAYGIHVAVASLSGALFGVTYRYIVRQEANPQLAAGAVGAFGLVRGLALLEAELGDRTPWLLALMLGESLGLFAAIQVVLQIAFQWQWIRPFGSPTPKTDCPKVDH